MESRERKTGATMWQQLQPTRRGPRRLLERRPMVGTGTGSEGIFHAECEVFFMRDTFNHSDVAMRVQKMLMGRLWVRGSSSTRTRTPSRWEYSPAEQQSTNSSSIYRASSRTAS